MLSCSQKVLLASLDLSEDRGVFCAEELVVRAWRMFPKDFGLDCSMTVTLIQTAYLRV